MAIDPNIFYSTPIRRKVFISYFKGDKYWLDQFVNEWGPNGSGVLTPKALGVHENDDFVNSTNPEYIMSQIRSKYLEDSSVTIVLIGECTHSRRYVDWEIKSSLRQGTLLTGPTPNGLIGILVPSLSNGPPWPNLPSRLSENLGSGEGILRKEGYANYYRYPQSASELRSWIEAAFESRTSKTLLIKNSQEMMKYNATCKAHNTVHTV